MAFRAKEMGHLLILIVPTKHRVREGFIPSSIRILLVSYWFLTTRMTEIAEHNCTYSYVDRACKEIQIPPYR